MSDNSTDVDIILSDNRASPLLKIMQSSQYRVDRDLCPILREKETKMYNGVGPTLKNVYFVFK